MQTLGDCSALVQKEFPTIDDVLLNYVESILETSGDDFENEEDIFEAIGAVLQEVDRLRLHGPRREGRRRPGRGDLAKLRRVKRAEGPEGTRMRLTASRNPLLPGPLVTPLSAPKAPV
mgnify:CR=1 FL=1